MSDAADMSTTVGMDDVVVVSNRGPLSFRTGKDGQPVRAGTAGGLAATLHPLLAGTGATWVAAAMSEADRQAIAGGLMAEDDLRIVPVEPDAAVYRMAYDVVANATLWFCHHHLFDLPRRPRIDHRWFEAWDAFRALNRQFAEAVAESAPPGARVLVQDYHLSLLGPMLASARPDLRTVHFSHTPFADPGMLRALPTAVGGELLAGMAGFGACGFHTARWERTFRAAFEDAALADAARRAGADGPPSTFAAGLGPHPDAMVAQSETAEVAESRARLQALTGGRRLIVRVDRVELSKNILRGLWAFDELLAAEPQWRNQVVLVALAYPSREGLADYLAYRSEIEHAAAQVNEAWGTPEWTPVLLSVEDDRARSIAALSAYDVLLVNPVRDGMNLVVKEGPLVNRVDGAVVLSREAGAWEELAGEVLGVNPFDVHETAGALDRALSMDAAERSRRASGIRAKVRASTAAVWLERQLAVAAALDPPGPVAAPAGPAQSGRGPGRGSPRRTA